MSETSLKRSDEFLGSCDQFQLGALTTESSHPVTADLSEVARRDVAAALGLLFEADGDVVRKYREFAESGRAAAIRDTLLHCLRNGGRMFFTGCGATGRLSIQLASIWRDFWQQQAARGLRWSPLAAELEQRALTVMAGGDYALIKAVEGFEDFTAFGQKQIGDLGVCDRDVVFAITEGGETSFVIGTAWQGLEVGAKVYFVYNNPDAILCRHVERSRRVIEAPRIEKINLTTGPMAITGSTRMQATTMQLCVLLTVLEMVVRELLAGLEPTHHAPRGSDGVPDQFLRHLTALHATLQTAPVLSHLAQLTALETSVYRAGRKCTYFADRLGIDVLTDTTERSPTYCTPPFRKFDDVTATDSWAFLCVPAARSAEAWEAILKRRPNCIAWSEREVRALVDEEQAPRVCDIVSRIGYAELMRFKVGVDGLPHRPLGEGDCAAGILCEAEKASLLSPRGFHRVQLGAAQKAGARLGVVYFAREGSLHELSALREHWNPDGLTVPVPVPETDFLLDGITRVGVKMLLNAHSTCTMVSLGRVMGNYMIWVVPSNLKLIDRATRYIQKLADLDYRAANRLLFEVIEYVEPRMKADQAYPPVVGLAVLRQRHGLDNRQAERRFDADRG